jgi:tRNA nucleotidyltransferase (CCA-adding enzyme)
MNILLAGGAVRNLLLGRAVADKDFLVLGATRESFLRRFPEAREAGRSHTVFLLNGEEYSFLRGETVEKDLLARDFTVNAMVLDQDGELTAHPLALADLHARLLRPASKTSFIDDPLRVFRAARFLAEYADFQPTDELFALARELPVPETASLAPERVGRELRRALAGERPGRFLRFLHDSNQLAPWFEEFSKADAVPAGPPRFHKHSVLGHTEEIMNKLAGLGEVAVWMALVHDMGKCATPERLLPRHHGHDVRGEPLARALGQRLRLPERLVEAGAAAARWHMLAGRYDELRPGTRVDLLLRLEAKGFVEPLFRLAAADHGPDHDHGEAARRDLAALKAVRLPPEERNLGSKSGSLLRQRRIRALKDA